MHCHYICVFTTMVLFASRSGVSALWFRSARAAGGRAPFFGYVSAAGLVPPRPVGALGPCSRSLGFVSSHFGRGLVSERRRSQVWRGEFYSRVCVSVSVFFFNIISPSIMAVDLAAERDVSLPIWLYNYKSSHYGSRPRRRA